MAFNVPEAHRVKRGPYASQVSSGNNGFFVIPFGDREKGPHFQCVASDGLGWEHVSVSLINISHSGKTYPIKRCPTWEEMCRIKSIFWDEEKDVVLQYHPAKSEYVSMAEFVLHLWRPVDQDGKPIELPRPNPLQVGVNISEKQRKELENLTQ